ncbi:MAG: DUF1499 domain-containing protein [Gammaproteobacteria bacterium]|nr:DUF1499 domain-containing protein [Gammaproteobacteria bacterium]
MILIAIVVFVPLSMLTPILLNGVSVFEAPGPIDRLKIYWTQNVAETRQDHRFPELRLPVYDVPAQNLFQRIESVLHEQGWSIASVNQDALTVSAVVISPLWGFKDDIQVRVTPVDAQHSVLVIRSASRIGRGDFGANLAHIRRVIKALG